MPAALPQHAQMWKIAGLWQLSSRDHSGGIEFSMKTCDPVHSFVRKLTLRFAVVAVLLTLSASTLAQEPKPSVPEYEGEFFTDLTHSIQSRIKVDISRTLRLAHRRSHVHGVLVVLNSMRDFPDMPQDFPKFTAKLFKEWQIGDADTHKAVLVVFAIKDRKFGVNYSTGLTQKLSDQIRKDMVPDVTNALKANDIGKAMKSAAEVLADNLPDASNRSGTSRGGVPGAPVKHTTRTTRERRSLPSSSGGSHSSGQSSSFGGFGCFGLIIGAFILFAIVSAIGGMFSGRRHGYGGGMGGGYYGGGGGGGFMSGMLTGGLMGYMFGNSGHSHGYGGHGSHYGGGDFTETTTTESWTDGGGGGGFDSGGGGFDTFGGSDMDGGSFGEW